MGRGKRDHDDDDDEESRKDERRRMGSISSCPFTLLDASKKTLNLHLLLGKDLGISRLLSLGGGTTKTFVLDERLPRLELALDLAPNVKFGDARGQNSRIKGILDDREQLKVLEVAELFGEIRDTIVAQIKTLERVDAAQRLWHGGDAVVIEDDDFKRVEEVNTVGNRRDAAVAHRKLLHAVCVPVRIVNEGGNGGQLFVLEDDGWLDFFLFL